MPLFNKRSTAEHVSEGIDLSGKNIIITGANTGIGRETARVLALRGAHVIMACRSQSKAATARDELIAGADGAIVAERLELMSLDLSSLNSIRTFADSYLSTGRPLHLLINNAGVMHPEKQLTTEGYEAQYGINYLGHFLLTHLLLPPLLAAQGARVVVVSSSAMIFGSMDSDDFVDLNWKQRPYKAMKAYGDSKLMNALFAIELQRRYASQGITSNYLHPGIIATELGRDQNWFFRLMAIFMLPVTKSIAQGAATTVLLATAEEYEQRGGLYLGDCSEWKPAKALVSSPHAAEKLWNQTTALLGL